MEENNLRQMGSGHHRKRLQTGIHRNSSILGYKTYKNFRKKHASCTKRNELFARKTGCGKSECKGNAFRFLQHIVSSPKEERGNETRNKLEASQSILSQETFQDGYFEQGVKPGYERRLGSNNRFKRCILPFENFQRSSEVPSILLRRGGLSVLVPRVPRGCS